jgi:hypothetical protein
MKAHRLLYAFTWGFLYELVCGFLYCACWSAGPLLVRMLVRVLVRSVFGPVRTEHSGSGWNRTRWGEDWHRSPPDEAHLIRLSR